MNNRYTGITTALLGSTLLAACTSSPSIPGTATTPTSQPAAAVPHSGAPKVSNPLPAKVLDGSPCDSALTTGQLTEFLGQPGAPKRKTDVLGTTCSWTDTIGSGVRLQVGYDTKSDQGISLAYQNVKPKADRWVELEPIQNYPAIGYANVDLEPGKKRSCTVVVGVTDELTYSVGLILSDRAAAQDKDACTLGRVAADAVMTNLKKRA